MSENKHHFEFNCCLCVKQDVLCFSKALVIAQLIIELIFSAKNLIQDSRASCKMRGQVGFTRNVRLRHAIQNTKNPQLLGLIDKRWRLIGLQSCD